jgi:hypothetical protein
MMVRTRHLNIACLRPARSAVGYLKGILEGHCVMTNHFHLVVRTPEGNLSYGMKCHRFRKVHGKLFQGRFKSLIVEGDGYLGALQHYVHLNPVSAGMCGSPMCSNVWIASKLNMGAPQSVSILTSRFKQQQKQRKDIAYYEFIQNITK